MKYTTREACYRAGVTDGALHYWVLEGLIKPKKMSRYYMYSESDIEKILILKKLKVDHSPVTAIKLIMEIKDALDDEDLNKIKKLLEV